MTANRSYKRFFTCVVAATAAISSFWIVAEALPETAVAEGVAHEARFTEDGQLIRPRNWREWIFVGMPVTPNALNGGKAVLPETQTVYIDRTSWKHWKENGTFRKGTMFAVELTLLLSDGAHEDGSTTQVIGRGFFQDDFSGLLFSVKDSKRFPDEPGHWAILVPELAQGKVTTLKQ